MNNEYAELLDYNNAVQKVEKANILSLEKIDFLLFLNKFHDLSFYSNTDLAVNYIEAQNNLKLPENIRSFRKTIASVMYGSRVEFKLRKFTTYTPRSDELKNYWYSLSMSPITLEGSVREILLNDTNEELFFPIANITNADVSGIYLALNIRNNDKKIYEFNILDVFDSQSEGSPIIQSIYPVFDSYPQMLAHISEIKYLDGKKEIIVKARET
jgi:hypothetical protein